MHFQHDDALWRDFPALVPGALYVEGITADAEPKAGQYEERARTRLAAGPESEDTCEGTVQASTTSPGFPASFAIEADAWPPGASHSTITVCRPSEAP